MEIEYLIGSKNDFYDFIEGIGFDDKVAILTHIDVDGISSGVFLEKILNSKEIEVQYINFLNINNDMIQKEILKLKEEGITKVFITDLGVEEIDFDGFKELRNEFDVFLIDHHPTGEKLIDKKNIIKTSSNDCSAITIFDLSDGIIDTGEWAWLACAAIFSDFSYKKKEHFDYMKKIYPELTEENISSSIPGINGRKINSALIYYKHNIRYVYDLVRVRNMDEVSETHELIENEIDRLVKEFFSKKEFYPEKDLYFYEVESKFDVLSSVTSLVSKMKEGGTFVFMQRFSDVVKFSARNQNGTQDVGELMKKCVMGLTDANGGGHAPAAAAKIKPEQVEVFKQRLIL